MNKPKNERKLLDNPIVSSMVVPVAIILVGAFIIFGVTKILSTERDYKDLVREMHSKTFGNRWIAAYELSKIISSSQIPVEDTEWLIDNLSQIYQDAKDPRTRQFSVVAMGAMHNRLALKNLLLALSDENDKVRFHAVVAIGNLPGPLKLDNWTPLLKILESEDAGLVQAAVLTLATHHVKAAESPLVALLDSPKVRVSYSSALALTNYSNKKSLEKLREILALEAGAGWNSTQVLGLKLSVMQSLKRNSWTAMNGDLEEIAASRKNLKLSAKAREVLKFFKK